MSASSPLPQVCEPATLLGTNISPFKGTFEDDFPFPHVGYVIVPGLPLIFPRTPQKISLSNKQQTTNNKQQQQQQQEQEQEQEEQEQEQEQEEQKQKQEQDQEQQQQQQQQRHQ